jgi:predicted aminopeptidase
VADVAPYKPKARQEVLAFMAALHAAAGDWPAYDAHIHELLRLVAVPRVAAEPGRAP